MIVAELGVQYSALTPSFNTNAIIFCLCVTTHSHCSTSKLQCHIPIVTVTIIRTNVHYVTFIYLA